MIELGDGLTRFFVQLVKTGASLLAAAGLCFYFTISFIDIGHQLTHDDPWYWLCFGFALIVGALGCLAIARFVYDKWRERTGA